MMLLLLLVFLNGQQVKAIEDSTTRQISSLDNVALYIWFTGSPLYPQIWRYKTKINLDQCLISDEPSNTPHAYHNKHSQH